MKMILLSAERTPLTIQIVLSLSLSFKSVYTKLLMEYEDNQRTWADCKVSYDIKAEQTTIIN